MVADSRSTDEQGPEGNVKPKRLPWVWTILLLLVLPATALGLWYGGTRHRVDDYPKKVKPRPKRLVPKHRKPRVRPAARPVARPMARPVASPVASPVARPAAPEGATK
jgi:hypothetical protein